jgi:hypothetical protein
MKKLEKFVNGAPVTFMLTLATLIVFWIIGCYIQTFYSHPKSANPEEWGQLGDFIGGILNPLLAAFSLYITSKIALAANQIQNESQERTELAVRPFPNIIVGNYLDDFLLQSEMMGWGR